MTYGRLVCDIKEHKSETHRTRLTVGGNLLNFPGMLSTPTATVTTMKCLFNSVISTPGAKCLIADVKNFYLNNDLPDPEYMKLHLHIIPQEIIDEYSLHNLVDNDGWVYPKIIKGMYGLKQAGIIANMKLTKHLDKFGYYPVPTHSRPLETQNARDNFHPRLRQLYNKIRKTSRRQPSPTSPLRQVHHFHGLGSIIVHRHHAKMGLHRRAC